jgi:hypothetical protein
MPPFNKRNDTKQSETDENISKIRQKSSPQNNGASAAISKQKLCATDT